MRAIVRLAILGDDDLLALDITPEGVITGDIDSPGVDKRPFLNLKWGQRTRGFGQVSTVALEVWIHDSGRDYARIENIMRRLRVVLEGLVGQGSGDQWVQVVKWENDSPDLQDDGHRTIFKISRFTVTGRY